MTTDTNLTLNKLLAELGSFECLQIAASVAEYLGNPGDVQRRISKAFTGQPMLHDARRNTFLLQEVCRRLADLARAAEGAEDIAPATPAAFKTLLGFELDNGR